MARRGNCDISLQLSYISYPAALPYFGCYRGIASLLAKVYHFQWHLIPCFADLVSVSQLELRLLPRNISRTAILQCSSLVWFGMTIAYWEVLLSSFLLPPLGAFLSLSRLFNWSLLLTHFVCVCASKVNHCSMFSPSQKSRKLSVSNCFPLFVIRILGIPNL